MRSVPTRMAAYCVPGLILLAQTCGALAQGTPAATLKTTMLPADLSVRGMFLKADIVVEAVLTGLILASIATWAVLIAKGLAILVAKRQVRRALAAAYAEDSLAALQLRLQNPSRRAFKPDLAMLMAASDEINRSAGSERAGIKERVVTRLHRIELGAGRHLARGTGVLATIGATGPFVGLFGTVWGIMNSFIGISQAQTTNLAVVAPGIAEALLATAAGLLAAIPAVVIYNLFARGISGYRATLGDLSAAIQVLVSRELDRQRGAFKAAAE